PKKAIDAIASFRESRVDGFIIAPPPGAAVAVQGLIDDHLPVVLFDKIIPAINADHIIINNYFSAYNATMHLIGQGCRNIAMVTVEVTQSHIQERVKGYKMAMKEIGLKALVKELPFTRDMSALRPMLASFLKSKNKIDAILYGTNRDALFGLKLMRDLGICIPDDIAVVTFDHAAAFELHTPLITTVIQPVQEIAQALYDTLLGRLEFPQCIRSKIVLHTHLSIQESSVKRYIKPVMETLA
ncbi:MAG: LacI family transcriptional regulator, partial [Chitinophagaceae bacterium]